MLASLGVALLLLCASLRALRPGECAGPGGGGFCVAYSAGALSGATWHLPVVLGWDIASGRQAHSIRAGNFFLVAGEMTTV